MTEGRPVPDLLARIAGVPATVLSDPAFAAYFLEIADAVSDLGPASREDGGAAFDPAWPEADLDATEGPS